MISDLLIIGSGPAGAQAAKAAIDLGATVTLVDCGADDALLRNAVPDEPFPKIRRTDPAQRNYFWSVNEATEPVEDRRGAHLTPPRNFVTERAEELLPVTSDTFMPLQSLALGGLGAAWGAGCPAFERFELEAAGLPASEIHRYYDDVIRDIGVSAAREDDTAPFVITSDSVQRPADIDTNAQCIMSNYSRMRGQLDRLGFVAGRPPLALLTNGIQRDGLERLANPYFDMDFYGDSRRSIYRPRYTIEELSKNPRFRYINGVLVQTIREHHNEVEVTLEDTTTGSASHVSARRVIVAAGALNSARVLLRSRAMYGVRQPLLCNTMTFLVCTNLDMLGRPADDRRHSLAQLLALYSPEHRGGERIAAAVYSYRSLLNVRLAMEFPMPARLGALAARLLSTSLTIVGIHHPEKRANTKWIALRSADGGDALAAEYVLDADERGLIQKDLSGIARCFRKLRCLPLRVVTTPPGASIHYAGTIPQESAGEKAELQADARARLAGSRRIYLGDSATWRALPAKGPTLTIMANARRVASYAVADERAVSVP